MGAVTYSDGIAIWKVVYYTPALFASVWVCARHGFLKSSGWFFLVTFCMTRLIGSCAQLATINNADNTAETIALVCTLMGTAPLLLSSLGLLSRIYYSLLSQFWSLIFQIGILQMVRTPAVIAFILCIVGATSSSEPAKIESEGTVHAGIILYLVVFLMLVILAVIAFCNKRKVPDQEQSLVNAVTSALPFILLHIIYSLCATFSPSSVFNPVTGSPTISLFMSVLEEMVVVTIYAYTGLKIRDTPLENASGTRQLGYRFGRGDFGTGKLGLLTFCLGFIKAFGRQSEDDLPIEEQRNRAYKRRSSHPSLQRRERSRTEGHQQ